MKHTKDIRVELSTNEIVSIARTQFEQWQRHREIIDYHIIELYQRNKISSEDMSTMFDILKKATDKVT